LSVNLPELAICTSRLGLEEAEAMTWDVVCATGAEGDELTALIPQMRAFARSLCHDRAEADDLAQDALASAWRHRSAYTPGTNLKAWVFRILHNKFYSDHRRSWRSLQLDPGLAEQTLIAVSNPAAALELDDVRRAMLELCDEQREALTLVGVSGLSYAAAAAVCGCAEGTVKSRVSRARQRLLTILSGATLRDRSRVAGGLIATMIADAEALRRGRAGRVDDGPAVRLQPPATSAVRRHRQEFLQ
jgi:RNA polymerase sigma-70 factor, ECF subfamily